MLHPIMSRLSPQATATQAPQVTATLHTALPPSEVLTRAGIQTASGLRVVTMEGNSYYQATLAPSPSMGEGGGEGGKVVASFTDPLSLALPHKGGEERSARRYFNVNTGDELPGGDIRYAQFLARHFTGDNASPIKSAKLITQFDDDYLSVNRLLPVFRVDFERDDGLRIYIETNPGRSAALVDDTKAALGATFEWLHTWSFAKRLDTSRKIAITTLLMLALASAVSGAWMYVFMSRRRTLSQSHSPLRRWHRSVAIAVALSTVPFTISATWHLWGSEPRGVPEQTATRIDSASLGLPDALRHGAWASINAVQLEGRTYYQVSGVSAAVSQAMGEHAEHDHAPPKNPMPNKGNSPTTAYVDALTGIVLENAARRHAISLAGQYSTLAEERVTEAVPVFKFQGEYGFVNKRLPVWRVSYDTPDHDAYYVETSSGALSTLVKDPDRWEGYSFAFLHKYHWLDFAGKNVRDFVAALLALGIMMVAALGLWLFARSLTVKT